ncbi:MAG TPA: hypothetical protein PKY30_09715 [Myxococcota bacterium]|nr:hypothetical protein [Myxococcota bacterium]
MKLKDGRTRMYLPSPTLSQVTADRPPTWPRQDADGMDKFGRYFSGGTSQGNITDAAELAAWWKAGSHALAVTRVESLHFSSHFIAFMDSTDGLNWTLYAPKVPMRATTDGACIQDGDPIYEDGGFRAGWRSTSIRCSGSDVVYRDPSVVYLEKIDRYVMFVVECRADMPAPSIAPVGGYDSSVRMLWEHAAAIDDNNRCQICLGECVAPDQTYVRFDTTTRVVFFVCATPDFQHGVMGPFRASGSLRTHAKEQEGDLAQFIGVPQAFLDPDESNFFLFYANPTKRSAQTGLHVVAVSAVARLIADLETKWAQGRSGQQAALDSDTFMFILTLLGDPTPVVSNTYVITDQHFYFCKDRLQMMGGQNYTVQQQDPKLTELWQFPAEGEYDSLRIYLPGHPAPSFCADPCVILDASVFGTTQIRIHGDDTDIAFNDPWITTAQDNRLRASKWVLYVRCAALGGLIYATASTLTPSGGCPSCGSY